MGASPPPSSSKMLTQSFLPKSIRTQNELLKTELGSSSSGDPLYRWIHSEDDLLIQPMVVLRPLGEGVVYDYYCACGKNITIHSPECKSLILPRPRWERRKVLHRHTNQWILCRWVPPPSFSSWEKSLPGAPYPRNGYYMPVGDSRKTICINPGQEPFLPTTKLIISSLRESRSKTVREHMQDTERELDKKEEAYGNRLEAQVRDSLTPFLGIPGEKGDYSFGGDPTLQSPNLRRAANEIVK